MRRRKLHHRPTARSRCWFTRYYRTRRGGWREVPAIFEKIPSMFDNPENHVYPVELRDDFNKIIARNSHA
jgi:hypothetical protein